ncbi:MAG TPA: high-potential iron-sulfur protein [Rhodocyclaceae bacterium]|nr:high-potential iron-sulfur protein [Rhodocyclaceae bacterium]
MLNRRRFMMTLVPAVGLGLLGTKFAQAQAAKLAENDPTAMALGYKEDASKVDVKKYSSYKSGSACGNCAQFQGKAGAAYGPCTAFGGKLVNAKGWCMAYVKKT